VPSGRCQVGGAHPTELQSWLLSVTPAGIAGIRADLERFPDAHHRALSPNVGSPHPDPLPGAEGVGPHRDPLPRGEGGAELGNSLNVVDRRLNLTLLLSFALRRIASQLHRLESEAAEGSSGRTIPDTQEFHADHASLRVVVQDHPRLDLLGFDDRRFVEAQVQGIALFVDFQFHEILPFILRSRKAVTTTQGSVDGLTTTRSTRPSRSEIIARK